MNIFIDQFQIFMNMLNYDESQYVAIPTLITLEAEFNPKLGEYEVNEALIISQAETIAHENRMTSLEVFANQLALGLVREFNFQSISLKVRQEKPIPEIDSVTVSITRGIEDVT